MMGIEPSWLLAGLVVAHLLTLVYAYWRQSEAEATDGPGAHETFDAPDSPVPEVEFGPDTPTVDCEVCGAENDAQYAFCRGCASELPSGLADDDAPTPAFGSGSV